MNEWHYTRITLNGWDRYHRVKKYSNGVVYEAQILQIVRRFPASGFADDFQEFAAGYEDPELWRMRNPEGKMYIAMVGWRDNSIEMHRVAILSSHAVSEYQPNPFPRSEVSKS